VVGARFQRHLNLLFRAHGGYHPSSSPLSERDGEAAHRPGTARHQHHLARDAPVGEDAAVGRASWDAEGGTHLEADPARQGDGLRLGKGSVLGGGAEGPPTLGAPHPHPLADAGGRDALADLLDRPRAVAVGDNARVADPEAHPVGTLLGLAGVDARGAEPHEHLARAGTRVVHLPDRQNLSCGAATFVPGCAHPSASFPFMYTRTS